MRYSEDHKAQTRERIINEAAQRFRSEGVDATGLQTLMKALGLTHGGFYAHFKSKDELVEIALQQAAEQLRPIVDQQFAKDDPLPGFIDQYLSTGHRNTPGKGCPLPTISAELGARGHASATTDAIVQARIEAIEQALPSEHAEDESVALLATLIGALVLSRSVADTELAERILESTRRHLKREIGAAE
ncbi:MULTISPECIES: TetR/AcrR family transcriptional regulator [Pseudomonas aeruginosa group]|uniref:TetR/AcrR family transcriptional regulator n=1 Tax=Pseudomonas aeruginosa group TaxID=136841 RepID=UPI001F2D3CC0|nr:MULTISPECIES: TetR/AcrR family transcriptional regulator [Pseudomonas aeruginosa group]MCP1650160.1 AcrR family transcriptional regulator [Pseudomonas nitroreducens]MCP1687970.1 AcrR family transcriptional regulator [Pseudomonas nitroreducens]